MFRPTEKVFISHSSKNKSFVRTNILPQLKRAKRDHWYDEEDIKGGDNYREEILKANLSDCDRLLVVVSKEALTSEWVKEELAVATKDILVKKAKVDARLVHRRVLPVKIDERNEVGEKLGTDDDVDLFMLHPYLTLVNFIAIPHNPKLDGILSDFQGGKRQDLDLYLKQTVGLDKDQRNSVKEYKSAREKSLQRLAVALRNPESLRLGFHRFGRLLALLFNATFQRIALAILLLAAVLSLGFVLRPEINIEIEPLRPNGDEIRATGGTLERTKYVRFQPRNLATAEENLLPPDVDIVEINSSEEALSLQRGGDIVRRIRVSVGGLKSERFVKLTPRNPLVEFEVDSRPVPLGPKSNPVETVVRDDTALIAVRLKNGRDPWRYARLVRPIQDPLGSVTFHVFRRDNGSQPQPIRDVNVELENAQSGQRLTVDGTETTELDAGHWIATALLGEIAGEVEFDVRRGEHRVVDIPIDVAAVTLQAVSLESSQVPGSSETVGVVQLTGPAPRDGLTVHLSLDSPMAFFSSSGVPQPAEARRQYLEFTIPEDEQRTEFALFTGPVTQAETVRLVAAHEGHGRLETAFSIHPRVQLSALTTDRQELLPGQTTKATVALNVPAEDPVEIEIATKNLQLSNGDSRMVVTIPKQATEASFDVRPSEDYESGQGIIAARLESIIKQAEIILDEGIRVPNLVGRSLENAVQLTKASDLKIDAKERLASRLFPSDRVRTQEPPPHSPTQPSIVARGSVVMLSVEREVPDLVGRPVAEALAVLKAQQLIGELVSSVRDDDVVSHQEPPAGEYVKPKGSLTLTVQRMVPRVRREPVRAAVDLLESLGFKPRWKSREPGDYPNHDFFLIATQDPPQDTLADVGSQVEMDIMAKVPDLRERSVAQASEDLLDRFFETVIPNTLARTSDIVVRQKPPAGSMRRAGERVTLVQVVAPVPNVVGLNLAEAVEALDLEDFRARPHPQLIEVDRIAMQSPEPLERRERGSEVQLTAVVNVPHVESLNMDDARRTLEENRLQARFVDKFLAGDRVHKQLPRSGESVRIGSTVDLQPATEVPSLIGNTVAQADSILSSIGLVGQPTLAKRERRTDLRREHGRIVVYTQRPEPGQWVTRQRSVRVGLERRIYQVRVPNLIEAPINAAFDELQRIGLRAQQVGQPRAAQTSNPQMHGSILVANQSPRPGTLVALNTPVQIQCVQLQFVDEEEEDFGMGGY